MARPKRWTTEQENFVRRLYLKGYDYAKIAELFREKFGIDYSRKQIQDKVHRMGLPKLKRKKEEAIILRQIQEIEKANKEIEEHLANFNPQEHLIKILIDFEKLIEYATDLISQGKLKPGLAQALVGALKGKADIILKMTELMLEKQKQETEELKTWVDLIRKAKHVKEG